MTDTPLSALPLGAPIGPADEFYSVQGGFSVRQPASALTAFIPPSPPGGANGQVQFNNGGVFGGLTPPQLTALIVPFSTALSGAVPVSPGGTSLFLRADGTFATPPGGTNQSATLFNVQSYNVSGSGQTTTGSINSGSSSLALASALDFKNNQGIRVNHAGAAFTASPPTSLTVTPTGGTGSTAYAYTICSLDANGGVGAAITQVAIANGVASLSLTQYNALSWTAGAGAAGYAVYGRVSGSLTLIGFVSGTSFNDMGASVIQSVLPLDWVPTTPPVSALADWLITTISAGGGSTTLTLAASATTTATSQTVSHDDTTGLNNAIAAFNTAGGGVLYFPSGSYNVNAALTTITANGVIGGEGASWLEGYTPVGVASLINMISPTAGCLTINSTAAMLRDLSLRAFSITPTAGVGVTIGSDLSSAVHKVDSVNVGIQGFFDCMDRQSGQAWVMDNVWIAYAIRYGLRIRNLVNNDAGDWAIANIYLAGADNPSCSLAPSSSSGIRIESSGGGKISNFKLNQGRATNNAWTISFDLQGAGTTIDLALVNGSIENFRSVGINLVNTAGNGWPNITISNIEIGNFGPPVGGTGTGILINGMSNLTISNIVFLPVQGAVATPISLVGTTTDVIISNIVNGTISGTPPTTTQATTTATNSQIIGDGFNTLLQGSLSIVAPGGTGNYFSVARGATTLFSVAGDASSSSFNYNDYGGNSKVQAYALTGFKQLSLASDMSIGFNPNASITGANDSGLSREGAGTLRHFNPGSLGSPCGYHVYNTIDVNAGSSPTNFERGVIDWNIYSNNLTIGSQAGGSGTLRNVVMLGPNVTFQTSGALGSGNNTSLGLGFTAATGGLVTLSATLTGVGGTGLIVGSLFAQPGGLFGGLAVGGSDNYLNRAAAGVLAISGSSTTSAAGWMNWAGQGRVTSDVAFTSTTVLATVTGLSVPVQAGRTYDFEAWLSFTDAAAGGIQAAISGTCTATAIRYDGFIVDSGANGIKGNAAATALGGVVASSTTTGTAGVVIIKGAITVNAGGTLLVQAAQNTSNGTATTIKQGSVFRLFDAP